MDDRRSAYIVRPGRYDGEPITDGTDRASWIWSGHIAHPSEGIDRTESTHKTANIASRMLRSWGRRESSTVKRYEAPMQTTSRHTAFLSNRWFQELHESTEEPTVVALTRLHTAGRLALR